MHGRRSSSRVWRAAGGLDPARLLRAGPARDGAQPRGSRVPDGPRRRSLQSLGRRREAGPLAARAPPSAHRPASSRAPVSPAMRRPGRGCSVDESLDGSLRALAITLPSERVIAQELPVIDPDAIHDVRERLGRWLAEVQARSALVALPGARAARALPPRARPDRSPAAAGRRAPLPRLDGRRAGDRGRLRPVRRRPTT